MHHKIFFDTNVIRNADFNTFFGNQGVLKDLSYKADILIPEIVFKEIIGQKKREYIDEKNKLKSNKIYKQAASGLDIFDFDEKIKNLVENIDFKYEIVEIKKHDNLCKMMTLAIDNKAPFEPKNDKGFKDTCVYFSVLDFLQESEQEKVYLCCKDNRLNEAFRNNKQVEIVGLDDLDSIFVDKYRNEYFLSALNQEMKLDFVICGKNIVDLYNNYVGNEVLIVKKNSKADDAYLIEVSEKEIMSYEQSIYKNKIIDKFVESSSFSQTHRNLSDLQEVIQFINIEDINIIFEGIMSNKQITWLINDDDMKQFLSDMLEFIRINFDNKELIEKYNQDADVKI